MFLSTVSMNELEKLDSGKREVKVCGFTKVSANLIGALELG